MSIATATFRNPRLVALALLVIVSAGLSALFALGRQEDPTITNLFATITTVYPGADPARIETLITKPIEDEMRSRPEVKEIKSVSSTGISVVSLELDETTDPRAIEQVWSKARDGLSDVAATFPAGAMAPEFDSDGIAAFGAVLALTPSAGDILPGIHARYAEELADQMRNVPGTKLVELFGLPQEEVLVSVDPARAAALGLSADAIAQAIRQGDAKVQAGRLLDGQSDMILDVAGDIRSLDRLRRIVLADDGQGRVTQLGDIATLTRGAKEPQDSYALSGGRPAILLGLQISDGLQVDQWMAWVQDELAAFQKSLPPSLAATQIFDQADYTRQRLTEVATNMAIGVALVITVLLFTLGARSALIVAAVLPLVSLATLASMNVIGLPIHQMSVTGLIVALGLLVDAAIVMTDEVRQRLLRGIARDAAVADAVRRLAVPLLASTVTTALSFVPMILLPGGAGDFVSAIAIAVVLMLIWSLVIAVTITPALAGWLLPAGGRAGRFSNGLNSGLLGRIFRASLTWSLRNPIKSVSLALVLPVTGFASMGTLTAQFFPGVDRDQFHIEVELAPGTSILQTRAVVTEMDAALRDTGGVRNVAWTIGESIPSFYYNIVGTRQNAPAFAQAMVTTTSADATAALLDPLQARLDHDFPQARILVRGLVQGPPVDAPVEFRIVGPDLETLRALGEEARAVLLSLDAVTVVRAGLEGGAPKVDITVDEEAVRLLGLDLAQVARQLEAGLEGVTGGSLIEATEQLPVRVQLSGGLRGDLSRIAQLPILPPEARASAAAGTLPSVPLSAVAEIAMVPSESPISRFDGARSNTIQAFITPDVLPEEVLREARAALDAAGFALPAGYSLQTGGDADARNSTVTNLLASLGIIITLSIATIVMTFNSFRLSLVTFLVAGLSAGLSLLSLAVFNYPFGITAIIGVIGSIGVSINAAIIILTGLQGDARAMHGDRGAMAEVVMGSSRHIISTTLTTFGGFLPLILGGGGFWPPFAMAIAGGVLLSTVVSFYFTPQMFVLMRPRAKSRPAADESFQAAAAELAPQAFRVAAE